MIKRSNWLHLRIGFSVFLLPVFLFSLALVEEMDVGRGILTFIILHFFVYPSSNAYNCYYDKFEESIGGLKHPPEMYQSMWHLAIVLLIASLTLGMIIYASLSGML